MKMISFRFLERSISSFSLPLLSNINQLKVTKDMTDLKKYQDGRVEPITNFLKIDDSVRKTHREIAYKKSNGPRKTGVVYIPGFMSKMNGSKAEVLEGFCQKYGFNFVRYDATGLGESKSMSLAEARLTHWMQDAEHVLKQLTEGPQIVVGSSMGGWISLYLAEKYPEKFKSILLLAPGVNFVRKFVDRYTKSLPKSIQEDLENGKVFYLPHPEYGTFPVSMDLAEDMFQYELDLKKGIDVSCPIRIIHGLKDDDVPYEESLRILDCIKSDDAEIICIKNGKHRLSEESNLELICDTILKLDYITSKEK